MRKTKGKGHKYISLLNTFVLSQMTRESFFSAHLMAKKNYKYVNCNF